MKRYLFIAIILVFILACGNPLVKEEQQLLDKIDHLHDVETMPFIGDLIKLEKQLESLDSIHLDSIRDLKKALSDSDETMMDWMNDYVKNRPSEEIDIEERITFYKGEVVKLEAMKEMIDSSIENATQFIKEKKGK